MIAIKNKLFLLCGICILSCHLFSQKLIGEESIKILFDKVKNDTTSFNYERFFIKTQYIDRYSYGNFDEKSLLKISVSVGDSTEVFTLNKKKEIVENYFLIQNKKQGRYYDKINDSIEEIKSYDNGTLSGLSSTINTIRGNITHIENYKNNLKQGEEYIFFKDGMVKIIKYYRKGVLKGCYKEYYSNGQLMKIGKVNGEYFCWFDPQKNKEIWYLNNHIINVSSVPKYIPVNNYAELVYGKKYFRKKGNWLFFDRDGTPASE